MLEMREPFGVDGPFDLSVYNCSICIPMDCGSLGHMDYGYENSCRAYEILGLGNGVFYEGGRRLLALRPNLNSMIDAAILLPSTPCVSQHLMPCRF